MIKTEKSISAFTAGIDQDTSVNKQDGVHYYDAENMRLVSNDPVSSGALTNVKGNTIKLQFAISDSIIGYCKIRNNFNDPGKDSIVFFAYNATGPTSRIYLFEGDPYTTSGTINMNQAFPVTTGSSKYGYIYRNSDLGFSTSYPIKAEGRYESDDIRKVYWVDNNNNIRYMILDVLASDDPVTIFEINPEATLSMPIVTVTNGGAYTAGMVQYSYQFYIKNGARTAFAPCSAMVALSSDSESGDSTANALGTAIGVSSGKSCNVTITTDPDYDRVRIVAIYYTQYNVNPVINIVGEFEYDSAAGQIKFIDSGATIYGTILLEEFRLFGQTDFKADAIASKNNYLFFGNITQERWNPTWLDPSVPATFWDARAVRFRNYTGITATVYDNSESPVTISVPTSDTPAEWDAHGWSNYTYDHDGINRYNDFTYDDTASYGYKYQYDGTTIGASGKNVDVEIAYTTYKIDEGDDIKVPHINAPFKNTVIESQIKTSILDEVYRLYIVFFNKKMQFTNPQWICDFRMPELDDSLLFYTSSTVIYGKYAYPKVTISNLPSDTDIVGWQVFRCERTKNDQSVLARGLVSTLYTKSNYPSNGINVLLPACQWNETPAWESRSFIAVEDSHFDDTKNIVEFVAPEFDFNKDIALTTGDILKISGRYGTNDSASALNNGTDFYTVTLKTTDHIQDNSDTTVKYTIDDLKYITKSDPTNHVYTTVGAKTVCSELWRNGGSVNWNSKAGNLTILKLASDLNINHTQHGMLLGTYMRDVASSRYGGVTYENRSFNRVIPYSDFTPIATTNTKCYYGDGIIGFFTKVRGSIYKNTGLREFQNIVHIATDTTIDLYRRLDPLYKYFTPLFRSSNCIMAIMDKLNDGVDAFPEYYPVELGDLARQNMVYSQVGTAQMIQCKVFDSNNIENIDTEILATTAKINNEYFDNWTNLYSNNSLWLDPKWGPIRSLFVFNNSLYAGQDKAICQIAVQERSTLVDSSKKSLVLGTGGVLDRYDYVTTVTGIQSFYDVIVTDKTFYFVDRRNKVINKLTQEGLAAVSEVGGYKSFMKAYGNITNVKLGFDPIYKEVLFHISDSTNIYTSVINEHIGAFTGRYTFTPSLFFHLNDHLYSISSSNAYYHNEGDYGVWYGAAASDSSVTVIINPNGNIVNKYDVLDLRVDVIDIDGTTYLEDEQFNHIYAYNNYQTLSKSISFGNTPSTLDTSKSLIRKWRTWLIPDDLTSTTYRMVDTYVKVKLLRHNTGNKKIVLHDIISYYRPTRN